MLQNKAPLVSVLMPVKDADFFLTDCIESIVAQSFINWELIAVDDHSNDGSYKILNDYSNRFYNIKCFKNNGSGIISALRLAFAECKGKLITRMDADDLMPPEKLAIMSSKTISLGKGHLTTGKVSYFSDTGINAGFQRYETWLNKLSSTEDHLRDSYKECVIASPNWMVFKSDLEKIGAFESELYPEDYDLSFRFLYSGIEIHKLNQLTHLWRDHPSRASRTDPNYLDNKFITLKVHHFLKRFSKSKKQILVWGAGKKGKEIVSHLIKHGVTPIWISNNNNKIGHRVYSIEIQSSSSLTKRNKITMIIAVANTEQQSEIRSLLKNLEYTEGIDYFFFC